jgi:hypothetical protein
MFAPEAGFIAAAPLFAPHSLVRRTTKCANFFACGPRKKSSPLNDGKNWGAFLYAGETPLFATAFLICGVSNFLLHFAKLVNCKRRKKSNPA